MKGIYECVFLQRKKDRRALSLYCNCYIQIAMAPDQIPLQLFDV